MQTVSVEEGAAGSEQHDPVLLRDALDRSRELADRLDRLQQIGGELAGASTLEQVGATVVALFATPNTSATRGLWLVDEAGAFLTMLRGTGLPSSVAEAFGTMATSAPLPVADAYRTRHTVRSQGVDDVARYPHTWQVSSGRPRGSLRCLCAWETSRWGSWSSAMTGNCSPRSTCSSPRPRPDTWPRRSPGAAVERSGGSCARSGRGGKAGAPPP